MLLIDSKHISTSVKLGAIVSNLMDKRHHFEFCTRIKVVKCSTSRWRLNNWNYLVCIWTKCHFLYSFYCIAGFLGGDTMLAYFADFWTFTKFKYFKVDFVDRYVVYVAYIVIHFIQVCEHDEKGQLLHLYSVTDTNVYLFIINPK